MRMPAAPAPVVRAAPRFGRPFRVASRRQCCKAQPPFGETPARIFGIDCLPVQTRLPSIRLWARIEAA
jgi:hypothetical protein